MLKRTVEFMVTTDGGICSGSTISARSSSARNAALPGNAFSGSDSSKASSRSRSRDVSIICGLLSIFYLIQISIQFKHFRETALPSFMVNAKATAVPKSHTRPIPSELRMTRFKPRARIAPSKTLAELDQYRLRARRNQPASKEEAPFYTKLVSIVMASAYYE